VSGQRLLVAVGRRTNLAELGIGAIGLDEEANAIEVDSRMRAAAGVWAVGDVTGKGAFTHVSMYQARIAAADILGEDGEAADYRALPAVTFTDPEVGTVGLTESAARERGIPVTTGLSRVPSSARGWIHKAGNEGLIKLVCDSGRDVLVGATVVAPAPAGGEVLGALAVAVHAEVPVSRLRTMIYAYPTFHRGIEDALTNLTEP
jgi:pyruvate/2-oxoglutarate dehydrogenase complex dihydrolipoamide dehydrogenase (E3) component